MDHLTKGDVPLGLGMAFAQNVQAMNQFASLSKEQQQAILNKAGTIKSKQEMQSFVQSIAENKSSFS